MDGATQVKSADAAASCPQTPLCSEPTTAPPCGAGCTQGNWEGCMNGRAVTGMKIWCGAVNRSRVSPGCSPACTLLEADLPGMHTVLPSPLILRELIVYAGLLMRYGVGIPLMGLPGFATSLPHFTTMEPSLRFRSVYLHDASHANRAAVPPKH